MMQMSHKTQGESKDIVPTTWDTDWDYYSAADHVVITPDPKLCWILEVLIVTFIT